MSEFEKLSDKIFDEMLYHAAVDVNLEEGEKFFIPDDDVEFSKEHNRKMKKLFQKLNKKKNQRRIIQFSRVAVILILISAVSIGVGSSDARAWVMQLFNFVFKSDRPNSDYNFRELGGTYYSDDNIILDYIPAGFEMTENEVSSIGAMLKFESGEQYFEISKNSLSVNSSVDTEDGKIEELTVNGNKAFYIETKIIHALIWRDENNVYKISGNISQNEIIKIGENILK